MKDERFDGYTNYETSLTRLWLDNEEGTYHYWRAEAREALSRCERDEDGLHVATTILAEQLKQEVTEAAPLDESSLYADLLTTVLGEVNWWEIASDILNEVCDSDVTASKGSAKEKGAKPDD